MVDLHSHILPHMDDGPKTAADSIELIKREIANGIDTAAVTSHFHFERDTVKEFNQKRMGAKDELEQAMEASGIPFNLIEAAEVFISPKIVDEKDKSLLAYQNTQYILIELPWDCYFGWIPDVLYNIRLSGYIPILAHVERYAYFEQKPELLYELVSSGALAQANAADIAKGDRTQKSVLFQYIEHNLVHIIATDTHSVKHRPPYMKEAVTVIKKKYGKVIADRFIQNSEAVIENRGIETEEPSVIKKHKWFFL